MANTLDAAVGWMELAALIPTMVKLAYFVAVVLAALLGIRMVFPGKRKE